MGTLQTARIRRCYTGATLVSQGFSVLSLSPSLPAHVCRFLAIAFLVVFSGADACLSAQAPPEIRKLAEHVAQRASRGSVVHLLAVPMSGCVLDHQACSDFDQALESALDRKVAGLDWIQYDRLAGALTQDGFLEVDAFFPEALAAVAHDLGAQVIITSDVVWDGARYSMRVAIIDGESGTTFAKFATLLSDHQPAPSGRPFLLRDPATAAAFILWNNDRHAAPLFKKPECDVCPAPSISVDVLARHLGGKVTLLATVTESGAVDRVVVAKSPDPLLDMQALAAVRAWIFKPALDVDGNPFVARVAIDVKFPVGY